MLAKHEISVTQSQIMAFLLQFGTNLTQLNCDLIGSLISTETWDLRIGRSYNLLLLILSVLTNIRR